MTPPRSFSPSPRRSAGLFGEPTKWRLSCPRSSSACCKLGSRRQRKCRGRMEGRGGHGWIESLSTSGSRGEPSRPKGRGC
ncbi:hypothetical protein TL16_g10225 [Triparma laevis f. inornata]|uniref:Uncharacterized protein n=1 Tax=Triparma laevis f. inornata TaxID=1714386 RepID=A0A9W7BFX2_9STRA|nr:hypothetical protein TL16_g10225 [Triparma laevis f. inornata]